eukprot:TRINITY_DN33_c1_g2_i1.p1 TRINITY_DN33_c1_g2~~TRINITY_DN33_c1_g2_i1.p1  ORF type:complete len:1678 (-),score=438.10 TRINITY_DN33_c1_g2_i1:85-5118(-)
MEGGGNRVWPEPSVRRESLDCSSEATSGGASSCSAATGSSSSTSSASSSSASANQGITEATWNRAKELALSLLLFATRTNVGGHFFLAVPINLICFAQLVTFTVDPRSSGQYGDNDGVHIAQVVACAPRTWSATGSGERETVEALTYTLTAVVSALAALTLLLHARYRLRHGCVSALEEKLAVLCGWGVELVGTVLFLPCMHQGLTSIVCGDVECEVVQRVCGAVLVAECIVIAFPSALMQNEILGSSKHLFSCCLSRVELLRVGAATLSSVVYHLMGIDGVPHIARPLAVSAVVIGYACLGVALVGATSPYYRWWANHWRIAEYSALAITSAIGILAALAPAKAGIGLFAIWCCAVPAAIAVGFCTSFFVFFFVARRLRKRIVNYILNAEKDGVRPSPSLHDVDSEEDDPEMVADSNVPLLKNFHILTLATMHVFWEVLRNKDLASIPQETVLDRLSQILLMSMSEKKSKGSAYNEAIYCLFTVNTSTELQHLFVHLKRAFSMHPWPDVQLLLLRIDQHRRDIVRSLDKGAEEIQQGITEADKYTQKAADLLRKFWFCQLTGKYTQLLTVVAELDRVEHKTLDIFNSLQAKYPKSVMVMRQRAKFVDEILHDSELARNLLTAADDVEEQEARSRHKRHHRRTRSNNSLHSALRKSTPQGKTSGKVAPIESDAEQETASEMNSVKFDLTTSEGGTKEANLAISNPPQKTSMDANDVTEAADVVRAQQKAASVRGEMWYRQQVGQLRSRAFIQLFLATWLIMAILLANVIVSYAFVKTGFNKVVTAYTSMTEASEAHAYAPESVIQIENLLSALILGDTTAASEARSSIVNASYIWLDLEHDLYKKSAKHESIPLSVFSSKGLNCTTYNTMTRSRTYEPCSLHQLVSEMTRRMGALAADSEVVDRESFVESADARYILDNSPFTARPALDSLVSRYEADVLDTLEQAELIMLVLMPCTVAVVVICLAMFFIRSIFLLHVEKKHILQLFASVPPQVAERVYVAFGGKHSDVAEHAAAATRGQKKIGRHEGDQQGISVHMQLGLPSRFLLGVLLVAALSLTLTIMGFIELRLRHVTTKYTCALFSEKTILRRQHAIAVQYVNEDISFYSSMDNLRYQMALAVEKFEVIQSTADDLLKDMPYYYKDGALETMMYDKNCSNILGLPAATCKGIMQLDMLFTSHVVAFAETPDVNVTFDNIDWLALSALESGPVREWHNEFEADTLSLLRSRRERALTIMLVIFCMAWPAAIVAYLLIHFPLQQIRQNHQYTVRMFLLIPADVIDQLPQIKEYLETGKHSDRAQEMQRMLEDSQTKTEQILQAAADAIIVYDTATTNIEIFNAAAERIFGFQAGEVSGMPLEKVLPEYDFSSSSTRARHKDGTLFPVFVSKSETQTKEQADQQAEQAGGVSAVFVRDTRDIEEYQQLIQQNEVLLRKILPKNIAERLKDSVLHGRGEAKLIADHHESVSILFADIVKFSQWSTTMTPERLVSLLNALVSAWDTLAAERSVEKIKTIGDCYMCVCGCPEASETHAPDLVSFGRSMLAVLCAFNEVHGTHLQIRIGINSGPVVAGVIGQSKIIYDLWGPAVNMASRMESSGVPGSIQITENTYRLLPASCDAGDDGASASNFAPRGEIEVKGGFKVNAYCWTPVPSSLDVFAVVPLVKDKSVANFSDVLSTVSNV